MLHKLITVSASGKIHLLGEHSVVYGYPALMSAVDRRAYASVGSRKLEARGKKSELSNGILFDEIRGDNLLLLLKIVGLFKKEFKIKSLPPTKISIKSEVPTGSGMGSSAAVSAALIGALMRYVFGVWDLDIINKLAFEAEKLSHGNPSGADNTAVVYGGFLRFQKSKKSSESMKPIRLSTDKIPKFYIFNSGKPVETTREMVEMVGGNFRKRRSYYKRTFQNQGEETDRLINALENKDDNLIKQSILNGEKNLEKIGVVGKKAQQIIRLIEKHGGAAKICGAGGVKRGSGIILCFHENLLRLKSLEKKLNVRFENISLGEEGIRPEKLDVKSFKT